MTQLPRQTREVDQGSAALVQDLKQRGMLDETLVVWGGEFGRTVYGQFSAANDTQATASSYGRDHNPRCYTIWMAGGGIKPGITHGATDDFSASIVRDPVSIHDLQATILHCVGIDHRRLTYRCQGPRLPPDRRRRPRRGGDPRVARTRRSRSGTSATPRASPAPWRRRRPCCRRPSPACARGARSISPAAPAATRSGSWHADGRRRR